MKTPWTRVFLPGVLLGLAALDLAGCHPTTPAPHDAPPSTSKEGGPQGGSEEAAATDEFLFCFWNVENLFDDRNDDRRPPDKAYDEWFAEDGKARKLKYDNLARVITDLNNGRGPDILALAECETTERTVELLRDALNARLKDPALHYKSFAMKDPKGGRTICNAILTRLPLVENKTQLHGRRLRILEAHVKVNDHDLVIIASHWTSRVSDESGEGRDKYGDQIYGVYKAMFNSNPKVDFLVCGDFNDPPDDESVTAHLHAIGDLDKVKKSTKAEPLLYNVMWPKFEELQKSEESRAFTHYHSGKRYIFDQIAVSPGLLDNEGWSCDPKSVEIIANEHTTEKHPRIKVPIPWRFGNRNDKFERGCSDHLPVTVRLRVAK
jgi:endonuclease/exonuclease/phosphatase family metal-dependent hydrolase